ncbi:hypothetical protein HQ545_03325 [Candidatus Woesearchaeota archaeon]|nr:hypothetical protein [Candidatus Woesearchaeota archaeon]
MWRSGRLKKLAIISAGLGVPNLFLGYAALKSKSITDNPDKYFLPEGTGLCNIIESYILNTAATTIVMRNLGRASADLDTAELERRIDEHDYSIPSSNYDAARCRDGYSHDNNCCGKCKG